MSNSLSHVQLFATPWSVHGILHEKNTGVDCHSLLQGISPTQGLNPGLLHCRQIFYCLSHQGSPDILLLFSHLVVSDSLRPHGLQHARPPCQSPTPSRSSLKLMSIESVMPSNHLILCHPLLLLTSIFPSIRVFSNEPVLYIRWPKYWSFSFSLSPSNEYSGQIS